MSALNTKLQTGKRLNSEELHHDARYWRQLIFLRQVFHFQVEIGTLPGGLKLLVHELRIVGFVLCLERFAQAKQRTRVAGIAIQIVTKDLLSFAGVAVEQQGTPKRLAYREVPVWRFAILEGILNGYRFA